jgi:glycosyltransferase involved in cell wall biosynthesis
VSVVVPCYNYGRYLPECVNSILAQDGVDVDVLVVDDASTDDSAQMARRLAADPRVSLLEHLDNRGHIATYNEGLAKATGEYVVLLSADDLLAPGSLARATALMEAHPEVSFVYGFSRSFQERTPAPRTRERPWTVWTGPEWLELNCGRATNPIETPDVVMRTSVLRDLGGYDDRLPHAADLLMWLRAATRGSVGRINGVDQAFYRVHGANMHFERFGGMVRDITERRLTFEILCTEDADRLADPQRLRHAAEAALARTALRTAYRARTRERSGTDVPGELAELARRIDAGVRDSSLWRRYERCCRPGWRPLVPRRVTAFADRVEGRIRWGRWRRTGILT